MKPQDTPDTNSVTYWKQVASDACTARETILSKLEYAHRENERLRVERDEAIRTRGKLEERISHEASDILPTLSDIISHALNGDADITISVSISGRKKDNYD